MVIMLGRLPLLLLPPLPLLGGRPVAGMLIIVWLPLLIVRLDGVGRVVMMVLAELLVLGGGGRIVVMTVRTVLGVEDIAGPVLLLLVLGLGLGEVDGTGIEEKEGG